jgi:hypothetical protein
MAKAELKTKKTEASVEAFLARIADPKRRDDSRAIVEMMGRLSGAAPKMWGPAIVGFGSAVLKYPSGRELDWMKIGFSPRKDSLTLYGLSISTGDFLSRLGKHKTGKGCLYIKDLADVDLKVLEQMIKSALKKK